MAAVTPKMVKDLRDQTLAGMSDCKKALDEAGGDMERAAIILRERGLAAAAKKAGRAASEGVVSAVISADNASGALVEVNCETDFVTRNDDFQDFVTKVGNVISSAKPTDLSALLSAPFPGGGSVEESCKGMVAKIGENIQVRRYATLGKGNGIVTAYVHAGGKVGVLVELLGTGVAAQRENASLVEIAKDVALQVAAMKPTALNRDAIAPSLIDAEKEVFATQYRNQGKKEEMIPKIVASRVETWFKEVCLLEQLFVKDDSKTVAAYVTAAGKTLGINDLVVSNYVRLELGEGVEKKAMDFASEVAAQIADASK